MSSSERARSPWWEPTWRRMIGSTVVLFVGILAFLVGRMRAGADPGLARTATPVPRSAPPATQSQPPSQSRAPNADPNDPFGQQQVDPNVDPGSNGTTDNFGNAVPDGSVGTQDNGQSGGTQGNDPPKAHVSCGASPTASPRWAAPPASPSSPRRTPRPCSSAIPRRSAP